MNNVKAPKAIDRLVGMRVREARRSVKLTQTELGEKIGITFQQVQKYEKGSNRISASTLHQIAASLDRPLAWFFDQELIDWEDTLNDTKSDDFKACIEVLIEFQKRDALYIARTSLGHLLEVALGPRTKKVA